MNIVTEYINTNLDKNIVVVTNTSDYPISLSFKDKNNNKYTKNLNPEQYILLFRESSLYNFKHWYGITWATIKYIKQYNAKYYDKPIYYITHRMYLKEFSNYKAGKNNEYSKVIYGNA